VITIVVTAEDGVTKMTYTLTVQREAAPEAPPAPEPEQDQKEQITIDVDTGSGGGPVSKTVIERTKEAGGFIKDEVLFTQESAKEAVGKLAELGMDTARLVIPDRDDIVGEVNVSIPRNTLSEMNSGSINLEIYTETAKLFIPKSTLAVFDKDMYFRVVPIKEENEKQIVMERAQ